MIHSASWPKDYQHAGKSVAVIGNGSSAVQIIPEIQPCKLASEPAKETRWILTCISCEAASPCVQVVNLDCPSPVAYIEDG